MNDNTFYRKIKLLSQNCTQGFIISNILLAKTPLKLRNSQIYKNCQVHPIQPVFVYIFEIHIIRKIFQKYMDPLTYTG